MSELILLKIRNLIADKEMVTAQANLDTARFNEWRTDYARWHGQISAEIEALIGELEEKP